MKEFLDNIAQLSSIEEILFLNQEGEPLYTHGRRDDSDGRTDQWQSIIEQLDDPKSADFIFESGRYHLVRLPIGTLLFGLNNQEHLDTIKNGCDTVGEKLKDTSIRRNVLLRLLTDNRQNLQPQHIRGLQSVADAEVADVLIPLLNSSDTLPVAHRDSLVAAICRVLGHCRSSEALTALQAYVRYQRESESSDHEAMHAAKVAIAQLKLDNLGLSDSNGIDLDFAPISQPEVLASAETDSPSPQDQHIDLLIRQNRKNEAIPLIMEAIREHAEKKNFSEAERYRKLLMDTDSMAQREIIGSAEVIEEEKASSINDALLATWNGLIQALSMEAFTALYQVTRPRSSSVGEIIAEQGDFLSNLFFVNSGRVQLYTSKDGRIIPFRTVEEGEIFGVEFFFDISVWTVSAKSLGASLSVLTWKGLSSLQEGYPSLQSNLIDYCGRFLLDHATIFEKPSISRRKYKRYAMTGRATMELLDFTGNATGQTASGDILDISQGGVAFIVEFQRKEYANDLLGKHIKVSMQPERSDLRFQRNGQIKAIRCHNIAGQECSIHIEFDEILSTEEVQQARTGKA